MKLPESFANRITEQLGGESSAYFACLESPMNHGIRVNTAKISVEDFLAISPFELSPIPWTTNGFYYDDKKYTPSKHPYYYAGLYYIQEPSAMMPASALEINEGDMVLDICAAPGGKSTELAAKLNGTGFLVSNDISNSRAKALLKNLELFGVANMCVASEPPNKLSSRFINAFDKILVDAPCSGEGMFRKSTSMVTAWENNGVDMFAGLQRGILNEVVKMLKPGGTMLYSTCTFSPEENERSVEYLLSLDESLELLDVPKHDGFMDGRPEWGETENAHLAKCARLWPHRIKGEGHFVALIHKKEDDHTFGGASSFSKKPCKLDANALEFLKQIKNPSFNTNNIIDNSGKLFYVPDTMPDLSGLRLLRQGLFLGEVKKNRFEPSQALAMHLAKGQYGAEVSLPADDDRVRKYLKGETIEVDEHLPNGYVLVEVDGYPLGWAKNNNGTLKNKYLPGWRMML